MKRITVNTGWQTQAVIMSNDGKAEAAYHALKEAMASHDRYGNDKTKIVSFLDDVGEFSFRVETMVSVGIEDYSEASDEIHVELATREKRVRDKVNAILGEPKMVELNKPVEQRNGI